MHKIDTDPCPHGASIPGGLFTALLSPSDVGSPNTLPFLFRFRVTARRGRRRWHLAWACVTTASCTTVIYPFPSAQPLGGGVCPGTEKLIGTLVPGTFYGWGVRGTEAQRKQMVGLEAAWPAHGGAQARCWICGPVHLGEFGAAQESYPVPPPPHTSAPMATSLQGFSRTKMARNAWLEKWTRFEVKSVGFLGPSPG